MREDRWGKCISQKSRRRGQALLLSVLIMIFIVLLGTTFISIVASNMGNTARSGAKDAARQAAKAGLKFVDEQLTGSNAGLNWRPALPPSPPALGNFYYTAFDRAQGWSEPFYTSRTGSTDLASFVKYPNPLTTAQSEDTANFMIRVSQVQYDDADNGGDSTKPSDHIRTGDIRIESIGFAKDDPTAFYRMVAYKRGPANSPLTASMRSVSNWDWDEGGVLRGRVIGPFPVDSGTPPNPNSYTTLRIYNPQMNLREGFKKGDVVTVWNKSSNRVGSGIIVENPKDTSATINPDLTDRVELKISPAIGFPIAPDSIVQKAAAIGAPASLNFDNDVTTVATGNRYLISGINNPYGSINQTPGSIWVNGGLVWFGADPVGTLGNNPVVGASSILAYNLVAPSASNATTIASNIRASGLFTTPISQVTAPQQISVRVSGQTEAGAVLGTLLPVDSLATPDDHILVKGGLVEDGLNRLRGSSSPLRQTRDFTPPDITGGGEGFGRYRQLTRYSRSTYWANYPQAGAYGYGEGIYINNPTDVEKVGSAPMTQAQLRDLWYGNETASYMRKGQPASPTSATQSLEQQHLRGWVSPDQFLPRGAEVVLNDTSPPTITITLDARADNDSDSTNGYENLYSTGTVKAHLSTDKMWRDRDGKIKQGVYRWTFPWPENGTIFAEGNVRIRGKVSAANTPDRSLTVVSMNNIYIEGSLSAGSRKVLLLAKRNVIVNPTQVLDSTEAISSLSEEVTGGHTIKVNDPNLFQIGDYITVNDSVNRYVVNKTGDVLTLDGNALGNYDPGSVVHTVFDPTLAGTALPPTVASRIAKFDQAIVRRIHADAGIPANIRLAFRHSAEYKKALTVQIDPSLTGDKPDSTRLDTMELSNKALTDSNKNPVITADDKYLRVNYAQTPLDADGNPGTQTTGTDIFADNMGAAPYQTNSTDPNDLNAADNITMADLYKQMLDKYSDSNHWDYGNATGTPPTVVGTTVQNNLTHTGPSTTTMGNQWVKIDNIDNTTNPTLYHEDNTQYPNQHPLFYFMASVGNRGNFTTSTTTPGSDTGTLNQQIYPASGDPFVIPMGTSVWLLVNGTQATLQGNIWDDGINDFYKVLQFGFAPLFVNKDENGDAIVTNINNIAGSPAYDAEAYADNEDALTSDHYFYQPYGKEAINDDGYGSESNYDKQSDYDRDAKYTLDSRLISAPSLVPGQSNVLVLQMDDAFVGDHRLDYYFSNNYQIPFYRISNLKLQNETLDNSTHELSQLGTGTTFEINAYVYAQEGGWQVIPGTYFDNDVKNGDDLNRDGVISHGESVAAYRYHRYNYQIVFTGAIMENQTATPGEVIDWTDKWATVKMNDVTVAPTYVPGDPANSNLNTILYYYDPEAAKGLPVNDTGFHAPVAPGLMYQG